MAENRVTQFAAVKLTAPARTALTAYIAWIGGVRRKRVTVSTAVRAMTAVAERHEDEVLAEIARIENTEAVTSQ